MTEKNNDTREASSTRRRNRRRSRQRTTKSNLILGMGETRDEIETAMAALVEARCDILTITQYLRPSKLHHPVDRWVKP